MSHLVIQGLEVETPDLKAIAKLSGASRIEGIGHNVFWLHDCQTQEDVAEYCARAKLDFAFVTQPRKLSDFRLLVMDMDSTLITIETIDETGPQPLARESGSDDCRVCASVPPGRRDPP